MLPLLGTAIGVGLIAGLLAHGHPRALKDLRFRWPLVLLASLIVGVIPYYVSMSSGPRKALQFAGYAGVLIFLLVNIASFHGALRTGFLIITLGWALNFIVIAANGGMPLSLWAWSHSGQGGAPTPGKGGFFKILIAHPGTWFKPLGDVIPVRSIGQVLSIGDVILILGIAFVIAAGMRPSLRRRATPALG
jgi:uncharacterized protein DUF5317